MKKPALIYTQMKGKTPRFLRPTDSTTKIQMLSLFAYFLCSD